MKKPAELPGRKHSDASSASAFLPVSFPVIGIGSSAGGLDACIRLLRSVKPNLGMAFVFIPHLAFSGESLFRELLGNATSMPVVDAEDGVAVQADHVYVIPPRYDMTISHGKLCLARLPQPRSSNTTVDIFLRSLAADQGRDAIGIILSGMATDGTLGLAAVKAGGGTTFAQDASAKFGSMPESAIAAGWVDLVRSPQEIAAELAHLGLVSRRALNVNRQTQAGHCAVAADHAEPVQPSLPDQSAEPVKAVDSLPKDAVAAEIIPAVVIAVMKSPRELLIMDAQRLVIEANQVLLRFIDLELVLAFTLCDRAAIDVSMGNSAVAFNLAGKARRAVESAQRYMAKARSCPEGFQKQAFARIERINRSLRELQGLDLTTGN